MQTTEQKQSIISDFERFPGDTGSPEVQVALLTDRIRTLTEHLRQHRHVRLPLAQRHPLQVVAVEMELRVTPVWCLRRGAISSYAIRRRFPNVKRPVNDYDQEAADKQTAMRMLCCVRATAVWFREPSSSYARDCESRA